MAQKEIRRKSLWTYFPSGPFCPARPVWYNKSMRSFPWVRWIGCVCLLAALSGCAYHGRVRRGLYLPLKTTQPIEASILIISDKNIPDKLTITDPTSSALYDFTLDVGDGTVVAVTDALGTLIARADAGPHTLENQYDFVADVKLAGELTRSNCAGEMIYLAARQNGLCTQLSVTLRRAGEKTPLGTFSARRWSVFDKPGAASVTRWVNQHTLYLLSPVLLPAYTQLQGAQLRRQFENHLTQLADELRTEIAARPDLFYPAATQTNAPTR